MFAAFHCSETSIFWICAKWVPMQSLGDAVQHFRSLPEFFTASRQKDTWNIGYWESLWNPIICGSPSSNQNTIDFAAASSRCRLSTSANIQPCRLQVLQCVCVCEKIGETPISDFICPDVSGIFSPFHLPSQQVMWWSYFKFNSRL